MQWWSANAARQRSYTVSYTRFLCVENAYVSRSTKYVWYVSVIYVHSIIALYIVCGLRRYEISLVYVFSIVAQSLVRTYSEWVIDGEYDWPPKCCLCHTGIEEGTDPQTTRLGCLHIMHTNCLVSHIKGFPPHTAPAGYACPACSTPIWPPKSVKDSGSRLHSKLKEAIIQILLMRANMVGRIYIRPTLDPLVFVDVLRSEIYGILRIKNNLLKILLCDTFLVKLAIALEEAAKQALGLSLSDYLSVEELFVIATYDDSHLPIYNFDISTLMQTGLEKNLFGNHPVSLLAMESRTPPPAFSSDPLIHVSAAGGSTSLLGNDAGAVSSDIVEIDSPSSNHPKFTKSASPSGPATTTRKSAFQGDRQNSEISYYADDEDANQKKYTRRGSFRHKFLRALLPFWSSALPTLPVTAPPRKDASNADEVPQGRARHQKSSRMDPRKILLIIAIMACMATMGILYYRIAQRGFGEELPDDELAAI
ncbi:hypothetical protein RHSIM_Rhsim11G0153600 [Rhododendron simsii]|uniref:RING-type domain-containing protein n=1 Tax=Rhododendron simsii TaxID=118357 RepID=A0A834G8F3_RHOSS|nr:hypothetical protein RHSIM_Rhsim11G0153600 [Rhododendron simsii]